MRKTIQKIWNNQAVSYLFFGGLTVAVNLICFYVFAECLKWDIDASNALSIIIALFFAYGTNTKYVFHSECKSLKERIFEFVKFLAARFFTMILELVSVHVMVAILLVNGFIAKAIMQGVVIALNYVFSKLIVYKNA